MGYYLAVATVKYTVGNEKLVKVLDGASGHLRGLLEKQGVRRVLLRLRWLEVDVVDCSIRWIWWMVHGTEMFSWKVMV